VGSATHSISFSTGKEDENSKELIILDTRSRFSIIAKPFKLEKLKWNQKLTEYELWNVKYDVYVFCNHKIKVNGVDECEKSYINTSVLLGVDEGKWKMRKDHRKRYSCVLGAPFSLHMVLTNKFSDSIFSRQKN
jgi:hypothetical protein